MTNQSLVSYHGVIFHQIPIGESFNHGEEYLDAAGLWQTNTSKPYWISLLREIVDGKPIDCSPIKLYRFASNLAVIHGGKQISYYRPASIYGWDFCVTRNVNQ